MRGGGEGEDGGDEDAVPSRAALALEDAEMVEQVDAEERLARGGEDGVVGEEAPRLAAAETAGGEREGRARVESLREDGRERRAARGQLRDGRVDCGGGGRRGGAE